MVAKNEAVIDNFSYDEQRDYISFEYPANPIEKQN